MIQSENSKLFETTINNYKRDSVRGFVVPFWFSVSLFATKNEKKNREWVTENRKMRFWLELEEKSVFEQ